MDRAEVSSVEAIAQFRAALLVYAAKVRPLLDEAANEVFRTGDWLRGTQRIHWENQMRVRARALSDAQQALFSAEVSNLRAPSSAELAAVHKAKRDLAFAEDKLRTLKRLASAFEKETQPRLKQIETLRALAGTDLEQGARFLESIVQVLDRYIADQKPA